MRLYINQRPILTIEIIGHKKLGTSYHSYTFKVISQYCLSKQKLISLRDCGFLGEGQEFICHYINSEGKKEEIPREGYSRFNLPKPSGIDIIQCSEVNEQTNEVIACPSINPYSGEQDKPMYVPYYVYECESRSDSSD